MGYFKKKLSTKEIGTLGEKIAAKYLSKKGFRIHEMNFTVKAGEVDIVTEKDNVLHFVEVKTFTVQHIPVRGQSWGYTPEENVHERKIQQIFRVAEWYLAKEKKSEHAWQIDVAAIYLEDSTGKARIRFIPNVA